MGDDINRNSGGSAKSATDKRVSHLFNARPVQEYIVKSLQVVRPFVEFLRMTGEDGGRPLAEQIIKIRDICSHKFELLECEHLIAIASSIKWLDNKFDKTMGLSTLKLDDQVPSTFYDMVIINKFVLMDFVSRNIHIFGVDKGHKWLKRVGLEGATYEDMMENAGHFDIRIPEFLIQDDDQVWLRTQYELFRQLIF